MRAGNVSVAAIRTDNEVFYVPDERDHLVLGAKELAIARLQSGGADTARFPTERLHFLQSLFQGLK